MMDTKKHTYNLELRNRIFDRMEEANYFDLSDGHDWKAIYRNVERMFPDLNPTDAEIDNEIKIFYTA